MTTTEHFGAAPTGHPTQRHRLRRSRTDRVGAGVAGGLGEYFGLDPVLFRVLFATAAFFAGAGLLIYLLAWAAIPEAGTEQAPIDSWIRGLRERRIPFVFAAVAAVLIFWAVAFSWWAPGPALPIVLIIITMVLIFGGRRVVELGTPAATVLEAEPIATASSTTSTEPINATVEESATRQSPEWVRGVKEWAGESREASRRRRRRALPVKISAIVTLVVALAVLGLVDAAHGIAIPIYFWFSFAIIGTAMLVGVVLRRTPWSLTGLLVPILIGLIGFGGTHASLHDGMGAEQWRPISPTGLASHYKLAFGEGVLDLRALPRLTQPRTVDITMASGQVRIIAPADLNLTLRAEVHFGNLTVNGRDYDDIDGFRAHGVNLDRTVPAPSGALGAPLLIRVHLADGNVSLGT